MYFLFEYSMPDNNTSKERAIDTIINYAEGYSNTIPTLKDYKDANVSDITSLNIEDVNHKLLELKSSGYYSPYRYDPKNDYQYTFGNSNFVVNIISIKNAMISLKDQKIEKDSSIFLKLSVESSKLGKYFTPRIVVQHKKKTYEHTLEPDAKGIRYLNLSDINLSKESSITLDGQYLSIKDQNATLIFFKKPKIKDKKIVIIAPHPDDAEISSYGLYSQYPNNVHIITITAGEAGPDFKYNEIFKETKEQYLAKGKKRTIDSITVPLYANIPPEHSINLGFFDSSLYNMFGDKLSKFKGKYTDVEDINTFRKYNISSLAKDLNGTSTWSSLVENLSILLKKISPDIIVTPHHALDKHADHKYSSVAVYEAIKKAKIKKGLLFLYTNHANRSEYYPYGKVGEPISLPPEFGSSIYFNSIYSHPLSKKTQNNKILSLEQMSDLRFTPEGSVFQSPCKDKIDLLCTDYSYLRRSVRSNELFFIIDIKNL